MEGALKKNCDFQKVFNEIQGYDSASKQKIENYDDYLKNRIMNDFTSLEKFPIPEAPECAILVRAIDD
jgi:hypothetical protein